MDLLFQNCSSAQYVEGINPTDTATTVPELSALILDQMVPRENTKNNSNPNVEYAPLPNHKNDEVLKFFEVKDLRELVLPNLKQLLDDAMKKPILICQTKML